MICEVYQSLGRRLMLVRIYRNQQEIYRVLLANRSTEAQAKEVAGGKFALMPLTKDKVTSRDDVYRMREFDQTILRGSRWNEPVDAGAFKRLLLIDEYDGDLWHEECPNLIQIIEGGSGDAFQQCKERLLCPELGLKEGCLRLSGIRTMILALKNPNDDSVARRFMAAEIS